VVFEANSRPMVFEVKAKAAVFCPRNSGLFSDFIRVICLLDATLIALVAAAVHVDCFS